MKLTVMMTVRSMEVDTLDVLYGVALRLFGLPCNVVVVQPGSREMGTGRSKVLGRVLIPPLKSCLRRPGTN